MLMIPDKPSPSPKTSGSYNTQYFNPPPAPNTYSGPPSIGAGGPAPSGGGTSGGTSGGGGGGGYSAPSPATPPAAPPPMKDVDWFNSDSVYRNQAGMEGAGLLDQLAQLLFQRGQGFRGIDNQRREWGMSRDQSSQNTSEDFASRGLLSSGMYRTAIDDLMQQYEMEQGNINSGEQALVQQLGQRDSLADGVNQDSLFDGNYNALSDIYGLLGQQGVSVGTAYNNALNKYRAESAARSGTDIVNTLGW
jgi:hypothetical protein